MTPASATLLTVCYPTDLVGAAVLDELGEDVINTAEDLLPGGTLLLLPPLLLLLLLATARLRDEHRRLTGRHHHLAVSLFIIMLYEEQLGDMKRRNCEVKGKTHRLSMELDLKSLFGLLCTAVPQGAECECDTPPPLHVGTAGKNHLNEEITPLIPTGIGVRYCQTITNLRHSAILRRCEFPL
jgi:hypothetical protein